ncbi:MAG: hypothetical protein A3G45_02325 [Candidatus Staskawiczbacteria bacterium RIFCSPLOWO2_12_FULL_37_15]|uniref:Uncharacterized protein n=1 Tax=Candidatus Staskawiczbacteria bacterium RIFCSPLOWO2_12_FULL_37_15 TaxID=1802218 RepID=A0A1G2IMT6_9BACT|nr:MAG: hypothetical protein A3G45_02325 [Candidatus Staskawiczbacteria bacterium RIFCSPLOWO2_12_FULL_37_15]
MKPVTNEQILSVLSILMTNTDWSKVDGDSLQENVITKAKAAGEQFLVFLQNGAKALASLAFRLVGIERDMTGWELLEPAPAEEGEFEPSIHEFLMDKDGGRCSGEEMVKRAKEQGALTGLRHAEAMLRNQERIPVEWQKYYLVFSEVWQGPGGGRLVWRLSWDGAHWRLVYGWLGCGFVSSYRLVASRKYQK